MIKLEKTEVVGWEAAIRGMRNPMNSWEKSDSERKYESYHDLSGGKFVIGPNDLDLMMRLAEGGPVHAKYRRMIAVYVDITAPLYWWKEFDTYKVGTVANSCSTMHKIHAKEFTLEDFSHEHLVDLYPDTDWAEHLNSLTYLNNIIDCLNFWRSKFINMPEEGGSNGMTRKDVWWQMIQLLPSSYNQKRTVMLNYEVLAGIYPMRENHKLDEWKEFCKWIEGLPYSKLITGKEKENEKI